jgi:two-component system sensor histidine kinase BaeS
MPPRRRPPWWPENEAWPPADWRGSGGYGGGYGWGGRGGGPWRWGFFPFGCLIALFVLFVVGTLTIAIWALAALIGVVSAPPIVVVGGLLALLVVALAAVGMGRTVGRTVAPIDDLVAAAARIERGDYSVRVRERGTRPVRSLARAFNGMSARLEDLDRRRRTFLADVAHELRTPLSVIAGQLEGIEDGLYPADAEHLAPIHAQVKALDKLIDDLRTVALAEAGSLPLDRRPTDIGALIDETAVAFAGLPATPGVQIATEIENSLPSVDVDPQRIRQVMTNLLTNAVRYSPPYGMVRVVVRSEPRDVVVEVIDNGPGIPAVLLPNVFERFAKDPGSPGSGLGLAIARDLVQAHGGTIEALSPPGQGTTIRFSLPVPP